jgi:hypothetical protein
MKLPFSFGTRLVFRLVLPGIVLTLALFPVIRSAHERFASEAPLGAVLPFVVVFLGWLVGLLDMPIYQAFEGRRFWPARLTTRLIARQSAHLDRLKAGVTRHRNAGQLQRADELELLTTDFPLTVGGTRQARYPTRLGNLITEFEEYPTRKYDADGVFYWPRIWWKLPKEVREALDDMQAMVDGAVYVSALLYLVAPLCVVYALVDAWLDPGFIRVATGWHLLLLAPVSVVAGYVLYRLSLPAHRQFGEQIKAMFDDFLVDVDVRPVLDVIVQKTGEHRVRAEPRASGYRIAWRYLRWHRFRPYGANDNVNIEIYREGPNRPS